MAVCTFASRTTGAGHLLRSLELAQEWIAQRGDAFLVTNQDLWVKRAIRERRMDGRGVIWRCHRISAALAATAGAPPPDVVLFDIPRPFPRLLRRTRSILPDAVLAALDYDDWREEVLDLIVSLFDHRGDFPDRGRVPGRHLGLEFAVIRREFDLHVRREPATRDRVRRVLVCLGGTDPGGLTAGVVGISRSVLGRGTRVDVIVGPGVGPARSLRRLASVDRSVRLHEDPRGLPRLMAACDIGIVNAGTTALEMLALGRPAITIARTRREDRFAQWLSHRGAVLYGGRRLGDGHRLGVLVERLAVDRSLRRRLAAVGRRLVDGRGRKRIVGLLRDMVKVCR